MMSTEVLKPAPWWTIHHTLFREGARYNYSCNDGMMTASGLWATRPKRCAAFGCGIELIEETEREALLRPLKDAIRAVRERHKAKAIRCNFEDCGCDDCLTLETALSACTPN